MAKVTIDGKTVEVPHGSTIIQAAELADALLAANRHHLPRFFRP